MLYFCTTGVPTFLIWRDLISCFFNKNLKKLISRKEVHSGHGNSHIKFANTLKKVIDSLKLK